ncbi:MAG TPA: S8 family serine peptidase, partial [Pyrinomonadaceae bacterium]|nr:S8 family serine peptidase [Pyrinomonadaceae bacterium]
LSESKDVNGHGTHVAGIAAGNDGAFGGVAPAARIVCVKTDFLNTSVADGIRFIFAEADRLKLPAVVNLSLGGHHDAHDGSDDLSALIAELSGPGRVVVAAAGNEGTDDIHAAVEVPAGQTKEIMLRVPLIIDLFSAPWVRLNGWYSGGACEISIQTSSGDDTPFQAVIDGPNPTNTFDFSDAVVRVTTPPASVNVNNDHSFLVELEPVPPAARVQGGTWRLRIRNVSSSSSRVDVWSIVPGRSRNAFFVVPFRSADMKIGTPGAANQAITVGSFTSRNKWVDFSGHSQFVDFALDTISDFSSPGPLRNGFPKPDVTAPGAMIVSCFSRTSPVLPKDVVNNDFRVNFGTSMACPYITGLVALLLEGKPTLDPTAIKAMLRESSSVPTLEPGAFHPSWGFGLIDAGLL